MAEKERKDGGGAGGRLFFYLNGQGEEEDSPYELVDDSDSSEDEWG